MKYKVATKEEFLDICKLAENKESLFFMYPTATYPLTSEQLELVHKKRYEPTVFILEDQIIAYANLYLYKREKTPYLGHLILHKDYRGKGYSKEIVQTMIEKALQKFAVDHVRLVVSQKNLKAIALYQSMGFKAFKKESREDREVIFMEYTTSKDQL